MAKNLFCLIAMVFLKLICPNIENSFVFKLLLFSNSIIETFNTWTEFIRNQSKKKEASFRNKEASKNKQGFSNDMTITENILKGMMILLIATIILVVITTKYHQPDVIICNNCIINN